MPKRKGVNTDVIERDMDFLNKNDTFVAKFEKMKQLLLILILFLGTCSLHQAQSNRFSESESNGEQSEASSRYTGNINKAEAEDDGPPNPSDPVPIDDYIPFLVAGALVLIAWYGRGRFRTQE